MTVIGTRIALFPALLLSVLVVCLIVCLGIWSAAQNLQQAADDARFASQVEQVTSRIRSRMAGYEQVLRGGVSVLTTFAPVTRSQWRDYVTTLHLERGYPGIQGVGFARMVTPMTLEEHIADVRAEGVLTNYKVWPPGRRDAYTPIVFLEPFDLRNRQAIGYDMFSELTRRTAMERARDSGLAAISGRVELVQEITEDKQAGFLLYLPVYWGVETPASRQARRARLQGFVYSPFRTTDLIQGILQGEFPMIDLQVFDGTTASEETRLYGQSPSQAEVDAGLTRSIVMLIGGRSWTLVFTTTPAFAADRGISPATIVLIVGPLVSIMLLIIVWTMGRTRQHALRLAQAMSRERESLEAKFHDLFAFAHDAIVLVDRTGTVTDINLQAETTFGYERDELIGQKIETLVPEAMAAAHVRPRDAYLEVPVRRMMAAGSLDLQGRRKDGTTFSADISLTPLLTGDDMVVAASVRDRTEQIAVETQMRQAQKMEAVGQLTGGMAHDFNNLLGVIIGNLDLLTERLPDDEKSNDYARGALDAALRGAELTQQLLAFARRQPLRPKLIDLGELAARIGRLLSRTLGENIEIKLDLQENIWPVVADPAQMEASIVNIANNARDAMPQGGTLQISVRNSYLDASQTAQNESIEAGDYVLVEISDNGTGMTREIADQIFQPFFTTKDLGKGTGLGLSMVFGFIKQSNGHVNVHSKVGTGTTFWLYLPRAKPSEDSAVPASEPTAVRGGRENILVVEDNADLRLVVVGQLEDLGYSYMEAADAAAAIKIVESGAPIDLLFTDIVMPGGMGGFELARAAQEIRPGLKVLLTSGFPDVKANSASSAPDSPRLLTKPYRKADLARALRDTLEG